MNNKAKTMRILGIIASASAILMLTACSSQTTVSGIISDASMNTVTVSTADGETVTFGTMEADRSQCNGLPLGAPITVTYSGRIEDNFATAVKISTPAEYCLLIGDWILLTESTEMGISIRVEGEAASINMATLQYEGWSLDNGKLQLYGKSIGNGQTIDFIEEWVVDKIDEHNLYLRSEDGSMEQHFIKR